MDARKEGPAQSKNERKQTAGLQLFSNPEFGEIRIIQNKKGYPMFCLSDVCNILEIGNPSDVKKRLRLKGVDSIEIGVVTGKRSDGTEAMQTVSMIFIDEPNLYRCIFRSDKPNAEKFQDWVFEEVLPAIRKTGRYILPQSDKRIVQIAANVTMNVIPSERHVFLVTTKEFARAMDVSANTIRTNKSRGDFKEDVHFINNFDVYDDEQNLNIRCTVWTKRGVIEHAEFLRSGYSKELREWVRSQEIKSDAIAPAGIPVKYRHNRLTPERLLGIMAYVSRIENHDLRQSITELLVG